MKRNGYIVLLVAVCGWIVARDRAPALPSLGLGRGRRRRQRDRRPPRPRALPATLEHSASLPGTHVDVSPEPESVTAKPPRAGQLPRHQRRGQPRGDSHPIAKGPGRRAWCRSSGSRRAPPADCRTRRRSPSDTGCRRGTRRPTRLPAAPAPSTARTSTRSPASNGFLRHEAGAIALGVGERGARCAVSKARADDRDFADVRDAGAEEADLRVGAGGDGFRLRRDVDVGSGQARAVLERRRQVRGPVVLGGVAGARRRLTGRGRGEPSAIAATIHPQDGDQQDDVSVAFHVRLAGPRRQYRATPRCPPRMLAHNPSLPTSSWRQERAHGVGSHVWAR